MPAAPDQQDKEMLDSDGKHKQPFCTFNIYKLKPNVNEFFKKMKGEEKREKQHLLLFW